MPQEQYDIIYALAKKVYENSPTEFISMNVPDTIKQRIMGELSDMNTVMRKKNDKIREIQRQSENSKIFQKKRSELLN